MIGAANWMPVLGGSILVAVAGYFGFRTIDKTGLPVQSGTAAVTGKEYRPVKKTYRTDYIGNQTRVIPQVTPEMYILTLRIGDQETAGSVERDSFNEVSNGEYVSVTYQRRRLTRGLRVLAVRREGR